MPVKGAEGAPGEMIALRRLLARLAEWERPDNLDPVAVVYREMLHAVDQQKLGRA